MEVTSYSLLYYPEVSDDLVGIDPVHRERISKAITKKIINKPLLFGEPLRSSLAGYRRLRVGDYRVVYLINKEQKTVYIICIAHRKHIYIKTTGRIS